MTTARQQLVADFETTTDPCDCRVWFWGMCDIDDYTALATGNNIDSFMLRLGRQDTVIYFHNLKFDSVFIIDWLFRHGYEHTTEKYPRHKQFTTLISRQGHFYQIIISHENHVTCELRDSYKKLPFTVKKVAESFHLPEPKGEINFTTNRPIGHKPTPEEVDYVRKDVQIIAQALSVQQSQGATRLTIGSDALAEYQSLVGMSWFRNKFPVLPTDMDSVIRSAYRGGWTYADERYRLKPQGHGYVYDVNSLYPYVMYTQPMPYGMPIFFEGRPEDKAEMPLWVVSITFTAKLKAAHVPVIQVKNSFHFMATEYLTAVEEPTTLCITNVDYELWAKHYDLDILSWNGGFYFTARKGFFSNYIDKWTKVKQENTGGLREIAKLFLNSLYGKFATNPDVSGKIPVMEDNRVKLKLGPAQEREPVYTPVGVFVTAYARALTINAAQEHYDNFAYADTDSLHLLCETPPSDLDVHPTRLGAWKLEYEFSECLYARAKAYSEHKIAVPSSDGMSSIDEWETRIAGLPRAVTKKMTMHDMVNGSVWHGKLAPKNVPGGVVLKEVPYTLQF